MASEQKSDPEPINKTKDEYKQWWWRQWRNDAFVEQFKLTYRPISPGNLKPGDPYLIVNENDDYERGKEIRVVGTFDIARFQFPCDPFTQQVKLTFNNTINLTDPNAYRTMADWPHHPHLYRQNSFIALRIGPEATSLWLLVKAPPDTNCSHFRGPSRTSQTSLKIYPLAPAMSDIIQRYEELSARRVAVHLTSQIPEDVLHRNVMPFFTRTGGRTGGRKSTTRKKSQRRKTKRRKTKRRKTKRRKTKRRKTKNIMI